MPAGVRKAMPQVRRERLHRVLASGDHEASRARGCPRARRCHHRARLPQQWDDPRRDQRFYETTEVLAPEDIADGVAFMVSRLRRTSISELWIMPLDQA